MSGMFPTSWDGGIPPNPGTPQNPPQAFKPDHYNMPPDTSPLYYGMGCDIRIRAPVLNSIISEIVAVCDHAGKAYEAGRLNNLANAISIIAGKGPIAPALAPELKPEPDDVISVRALKAEIDALKKEIAELKKVPA